MRLTHLILAAVLVLLNGCATTPPVEFYTLSPLNAAQTGSFRLPRHIALGVGPAVFPEFLDRPQIVTRTTRNRLDVDEFHRWGGSLQEDFSRILAQNLSRLLGTDRVYVYPSREPLDLTYRVALDVQQFDGRLGDGVNLNVTWTLLDEKAADAMFVRNFEFRAATTSSDYEGLVAAHSAALAALSRHIAGEIRKLAGSGNG